MRTRSLNTALSRETYEKLVEAFRQTPGSYSLAARAASCDPRTAKRCWLGPAYPKWPWALPIKALLEEEAAEAARQKRDADRAAAQARAEAQAAALERERRERQDALDEEKKLLRVARGDVLSALAIAAELVPAMRSVAKAVAAACQPDAAGNPPQIPPATAMGLLVRHGQMIQKAVGAAEVLVQLARTERGEANLNVAVAGVTLTEEEALAELEAIQEVLAAKNPRPALVEANGEAAE